MKLDKSKKGSRFLALIVAFTLAITAFPIMGAADFISTVYTVSGSDISGIYPETLVCDFLKNINAESKKLYREDSEVLFGYVQEGDTLVADGESYSVKFESAATLFDMNSALENAADGETVFLKAAGADMPTAVDFSPYGFLKYDIYKATEIKPYEISVTKQTEGGAPALKYSIGRGSAAATRPVLLVTNQFADYTALDGVSEKYFVTELDIKNETGNSSAMLLFHFFGTQVNNKANKFNTVNSFFDGARTSTLIFGHGGTYALGGYNVNNDVIGTNMTPLPYEGETQHIKIYQKIEEGAKNTSLTVSALYVNGVQALEAPITFNTRPPANYKYIAAAAIGATPQINGEASSVLFSNLKSYISASLPDEKGETAVTSDVYDVSESPKTVSDIPRECTVEELFSNITLPEGAVCSVKKESGGDALPADKINTGMKLFVTSANGKNTAEYTLATEAYIPDPLYLLTENVNNANLKTICGILTDQNEELANISQGMSDYQKRLAAYNILKKRPFADYDSLKAAYEKSCEDVRAAYQSQLPSFKAANYTEDKLISGFVTTTPQENVFSYGGKSFVMLDTKGESFYVITKDYYASAAGDSQNTGRYNAETEGNVAYFLNNEFLQNGNEGKKLPDKISEYIDYSALWQSEPGYDKPNPGGSNTVGGIGLLSCYEFVKYIKELGADDIPSGAALYWLRTPGTEYETYLYGASLRSLDTMTPPLRVGSMFGSQAERPRLLRPSFYLDKSFFENNKLSACGSAAAAKIAKLCDTDALSALYSQSELEDIFPRPAAQNLEITGTAVTGNKLTARYDYVCPFDEGETEITWYGAASTDGEYNELLGKGKELTLTAQAEGRFIKISVLPKSKSAVNAQGSLMQSAGYRGAAVTRAAADAAAKALLGKTESEVLQFFTDNARVYEFADGALSSPYKDTVALIVSKSGFTTLDELEKVVKTALIMAQIQKDETADITALLSSEESGILSGDYKELADKSAVNAFVKQSTAQSTQDFIKSVNEQIALSYLNSADGETIVSVLERLNKALLLTKDISSLTPQQKTALGSKVLEQSYSALSQVNEKIESVWSIITGITPAPEPGGGGRPSGGGGGGSIGTSAAAAGGAAGGTKDPYSDLSGCSWAKEAIIYLTKKGVVNGMGGSRFNPGGMLTREQLVKMAVTAFNIEAGAFEVSFKDVDTSAWYAPYIAAAYKSGIVTGISENEFGVGDTVTREQIAAIIYRSAAMGTDGEAGEVFFGEDISPYAKEAVLQMQKRGIITGDENGKFNPKSPATRAEAAVMIYRAMKNAEVK